MKILAVGNKFSDDTVEHAAVIAAANAAIMSPFAVTEVKL